MANIKHLVIVMMENRSFDEYFGTFPGVSGFFDQSPAFAQPWEISQPFPPSLFTHGERVHLPPTQRIPRGALTNGTQCTRR